MKESVLFDDEDVKYLRLSHDGDLHAQAAFLGAHGRGPEDAEKMCQAWLESRLLQVTLCSRPCVRDEPSERGAL